MYKSLQESRSYRRNLNFYEPKTACLRLPQVHSLFSHPRPPSAEKYSHCDNGIQKCYSSQIGGSESHSNTWLYCGVGEAEIYICKSHKVFCVLRCDTAPAQPPQSSPFTMMKSHLRHHKQQLQYRGSDCYKRGITFEHYQQEQHSIQRNILVLWWRRKITYETNNFWLRLASISSRSPPGLSWLFVLQISCLLQKGRLETPFSSGCVVSEDYYYFCLLWH